MTDDSTPPPVQLGKCEPTTQTPCEVAPLLHIWVLDRAEQRWSRVQGSESETLDCYLKLIRMTARRTGYRVFVLCAPVTK